MKKQKKNVLVFFVLETLEHVEKRKESQQLQIYKNWTFSCTKSKIPNQKKSKRTAKEQNKSNKLIKN